MRKINFDCVVGGSEKKHGKFAVGDRVVLVYPNLPCGYDIPVWCEGQIGSVVTVVSGGAEIGVVWDDPVMTQEELRIRWPGAWTWNKDRFKHL